MIVIAHHLGEDQPIKALGDLSVVLVAPSTRVRRLIARGEAAADGPASRSPQARPGAEVVPAGEAGVGSGAGELVDGEPLPARRTEVRAWPLGDAEARLRAQPAALELGHRRVEVAHP
jgi:hypothetical protein